jgi:hypothetical protein
MGQTPLMSEPSHVFDRNVDTDQLKKFSNAAQAPRSFTGVQGETIFLRQPMQFLESRLDRF